MERELPRPRRVTDDKFAALVRMFCSSANPKWAKYAEATKRQWVGALAFAARPDCLGAISVHDLRPALVQAFFDGIADRPGKQHTTLTAMKQLEKWAIMRELLPRQITLGVEIGKSDGGHIPWTEMQVAFAEQHLRPDLARMVTLGASTGQRLSDLVRMGPTHIEVYKGIAGINVAQQKTGRKVWVPIAPELDAAMKTWETRLGPFLLRPDGLPWTPQAISEAFRYARDHDPELRPLIGLVPHGLRGHACVRLRRAGATIAQIADMVGMAIEMVSRYCRLSVQKENAIAALHVLERTPRERIRDIKDNSGV